MKTIIETFLNAPKTITIEVISEELKQNTNRTEEKNDKIEFRDGKKSVKEEKSKEITIKSTYWKRSTNLTFLLTAEISDDSRKSLEANFSEFGFVQNLTENRLQAHYKELNGQRPEYRLTSEMVYRDGGRTKFNNQDDDPYYDLQSAITVKDWEKTTKLILKDSPQCSFPPAVKYKGSVCELQTVNARKAFSVGFYAIGINKISYYAPLCTWTLSYDLENDEEEFVYNVLREKYFTTVDFEKSKKPCEKSSNNQKSYLVVVGGDKPEDVLTAEKGELSPVGTTTISSDDRPLNLTKDKLKSGQSEIATNGYSFFSLGQPPTCQPVNTVKQEEEFKEIKPSK
ncbi:MAG: hypothetical protein H0T84_05025 [Tatlockia sp.]|nr:hypothetical protein [Tatlockia sp.]